MKSKFLVDSNERVELKLIAIQTDETFFAQETKEQLIANLNENNIAGYKEEDFFELNFKFKKLNNFINNEILSRATSVEGDGININVIKYSYFRLMALLDDWNLTDDEGKKLDINEDTIVNLHPGLADIISAKLQILIPSYFSGIMPVFRMPD